MYLWPPLRLCGVEGHNVTDTFLGAFVKLRKVDISFLMSVCPSAWNNSAFIQRIFMKLDI
jgi:hypothetical protein